MDNISEVVQILLSSAVVVAIINMVMQNKNNRLQYITACRTTWRESMKEVAVKLAKADEHNIMEVLTELKVNLNSYGRADVVNNIKREKMDFMKDQHIWEIILKLDDCIENDNYEKLNTYKKELIDHIGILLKFDWDRTKTEVKPQIYGWIAFVFAIIGAVSCLIEISLKYQDLTISEYPKVIFVVFWPISIIGIVGLMENVDILKTRKWYRRVGLIMGSIIVTGLALIVVMSIFILFFKLNAIFLCYSYMVSFFCACLGIKAKREIYENYEDAIVKYMNINNVTLYFNKFSLGSLRAVSFLNDNQIIYVEETLTEDVIDSEWFKTAIEESNSQKMKKYKIRRYKEKILKFPRGTKYVIKYDDGEKIHITIGYDKKEWKKWFEL